jgi:hypothetical protein
VEEDLVPQVVRAEPAGDGDPHHAGSPARR